MILLNYSYYIFNSEINHYNYGSNNNNVSIMMHQYDGQSPKTGNVYI